MHCYRDGSCFYYCESTFNIVIFYLLLNRCKFTLNCYFCFLAFLFRFLILSCAFEHFMEFAHHKYFIIIIIIIMIDDRETRFSERTMLYSHAAVQIFAPSISACGVVFCNCLNCQGSVSFQ